MLRNGLFRCARSCLILNFNTSNNVKSKILYAASTQSVRHLYSKDALGSHGYESQRERITSQMSNVAERFKEKMEDYSKDDSKNMIFSEDLKIMIHMAETEKDLEVLTKMMKKFNQQNKELRFGAYVFGPVVMRMFYYLNKPEAALECFKAPEMEGFFDQLVSYQILMDLLFENKMYKEVLDVFEIIKERQLEGGKYPRNIVVLTLAACYKLNSKESFDYASKLWKELNEVGHMPMRRAYTFCAALALKQGHPTVTLEVLTSARNSNYLTIRNLKLLALAEIGRVEQTIPILKSVLSEDIPGDQKHTFNKESIESVKQALSKSDNPEVVVEFNRLVQHLEKQGLITDGTIDEQLCQTIHRRFDPRKDNNYQRSFNQDNNYRRSYNRQNNYERPARSSNFSQSRPGLNDLQ